MDDESYAVASLKGGSGKTVTAVMLALLLALGGWPMRTSPARAAAEVRPQLARPRRVLLVDADPEQGQAMAWHERAGSDWPNSCTVVRVTSRDLAAGIREHLDGHEALVIDCGPKNPGLMRQALTMVDRMVIPSRPTGQDIRELQTVLRLAIEVDRTRPDTRPLVASVLLTQVQTINADEEDARALLGQWNVPVMDARIRMLTHWSRAYGRVPRGMGPTGFAEYADVVRELTS